MAERFSRGIGSYSYTEYDIAAMSDAELAQEIRSLDFGIRICFAICVGGLV